MANNTGTFFNINDNDGIPLVGVSTDGKVMINHLYGNCLIGSTSVTGTASQPLQVTGGAHVSGNLGIGTTNPTVKLDIIGNAKVLGIITASSFVGNLTGTATTANNVSSTININTTGIITATGGFVGGLTGTASTATTALGFSTTASINTSGIITATGGFVGGLTGTASTATTALGFSTTASINTSGIITATSFTGSLTGTASTANNVSSTININTSGIITATTFYGSLVGNISTTGQSFETIQVTGFSTFTNGPVVIGSGIQTGTSKLQVSGDTFITGSVGIGTTNPTTRISIAGTTGISFADSNIRLGDADTGSSLVPTGDPNVVNNGRGTNNFFAGLSAGKVTTTGYYNNFIGWRAGYANTSGLSNNFIGVAAGYANTSGKGNNFIGDATGTFNTSGNYNTFIGSNAGSANVTGSENIIIGKSQNPPILNGSNQLVIGAGSTAWIHGNSSYNVGIGTTRPTAKVHIGAATTSDPGGAPLKIGAGTTILATPEVGAIEYDGSYLYQTPNSTSGRACIPPVYTFRRTTNGANIGDTIADFFATPSSLSLEASSVYKITCFAYFTKTTAGTAIWTHTFSSAPTIFTSSLIYSPVTGIANGTQTNVLSYSGGQATASMSHAATASLTTGVNHFSRFELIAVTGAATNWRLRLTQSAGTATPLAGSFYTIEKVGPSTGTFVA